jgi:NAD(P)-dependent dehydrogenase (short-subunit alcohol dehydrogenase family)
MDLRGKAALVTGGARVGLAVVDALARRGCRVVVTYRRSRAAARAAVRRARSAGVRAEAVEADLCTEAGAAAAVQAVRRAFGRLDALVHMASLYRETPLRALLRPADGARLWREQLDADLVSAHRLALRSAPLMTGRAGGRIVLVSDWLAASGRPRYKGYAPYYVAKAGVKALAEALALELAPRVLVNSIAPGPILPPPGLSSAEKERVARATPLGRWGGPREVAKAVLFLIDSEFVTGECLRVDGGRHLL